MRFKVDESYTIRHQILETLFNDQETSGVCDKRVGSIDISKQTKCPIDKLHRYHEILKKDDEIDCCEENGHHRMYIKELGRYAYLEKKYLKEGRADLWDYYYHPMKVIIPTIAVIVSIWAICVSYFSTSRQLQKLSDKDQQIEQRMLKIEGKILPDSTK